jgi:hypothetical protein
VWYEEAVQLKANSICRADPPVAEHGLQLERPSDTVLPCCKKKINIPVINLLAYSKITHIHTQKKFVYFQTYSSNSIKC